MSSPRSAWAHRVGPQPQLPMTAALQRSEEDIMEVEYNLADAGIPSET